MAEEVEQAQWMPECDDCDDNLAEHYCNTCGDKLCTGCKDQHLSRKKNRNHHVVSYSARMKTKHKALSTCEKHPGEKYVLYCKPCQYPLCAACVAESCGKLKHELLSIAEAFYAAKDKATSALNTMATAIKPALKEAFHENNRSIAEITSAVDNTEKEMKMKAQQLHESVDHILQQNLTCLRQTKTNTLMPVVRDREMKLKNVDSMLDTAMKEYEKNLRSDDPVDLLRFMKDRYSDEPRSQYPIPSAEEVSLPVFVPACLAKEALEKQFGHLSFNDQRESELKDKNSESTQRNEQKTNQTVLSSSKVSTDASKALSIQNIMNQPIKQPHIKVKGINQIHGIRCLTSGGKVWMHDDKKMYLVNHTGDVIRRVNVDCNLYWQTGMLVLGDNELLFSDYDGNRIMKISQNYSISTLFRKQLPGPNGLCQTHSGDLLVCLVPEKVVRQYTMTGTVVRDIGRGSLTYPNNVNCNKVTDDICVSDNDSQVVVFKKNGKKRFTYTGDGNTGTGFDPRDLCCDQLGNILITDKDNHRVHIIDRDGHFLQYLVSGEKNIFLPVAIYIDSNGRAVVGEYYGVLKVYKYLQ